MWFSLLYNLCLFFLAFLVLPKLFWQYFFIGKYRKSLRAKLGIDLPTFVPKQGQKVIWIHAISMGETRAILPLFYLIRSSYPDAAIVLSSTTETGHEEAKRSMPQANAHFFLPFDFSWMMRKIVKQIQPHLLILCESDFWYHLLKVAKDRGCQIALVNGKVSERSCSRFQKVPFFTRRLFAYFDVLCVQSQRYLNRLEIMGIPLEKIHVTGNLKLDTPTQKMSLNEWITFRDSLGIKKGNPVLVIGSTHFPEEKWILTLLESVWEIIPQLYVFIVPRHPERFEEVAQLLQEKALPFRRFKDKGEQKLILVDAMGQLNRCYQIADLAIVGGSFVSHIGGHNIFEPVLYGVPVFFGPYMHNQLDLKEWVLSFGAGKQVGKEDLSKTLIEFLKNPSLLHQYSVACHHLASTVKGATQRTFDCLFLR